MKVIKNWIHAYYLFFGLTRQQYPEPIEFLKVSILLSFLGVFPAMWLLYVWIYGFVIYNPLALTVVILFGLPAPLIGMWIFKKKRNYASAAFLVNLSGCLSLTGIILATGGIFSPIFAWFFYGTITAFLLAGVKGGLMVTAYTSVVSIVIGLAHIYDMKVPWQFPFPEGGTEHIIFNFLVYASAIPSLALVTSIFDYLIYKSFRETEKAKKVIEAKNRDIRAILKNISVGIFSIKKDGLIHEEYSDHLEKIINKSDLQDQNPIDAIFVHSEMQADAFDQFRNVLGTCLGEDALNFEVNSHCLPQELTLDIDGAKKIVEVTFDPILDKLQIVDKILVTMKDVTEQRHLLQKASEQQEELDMMRELLDIAPETFFRLYNSAKNFIKQNRNLIDKNPYPDLEVLKVMFMNMHTIKGDARSLHLSKVCNLAHETEDRYAKIQRDGKNEFWVPDEMVGELAELEHRFEVYKKIAVQKLGHSDKDTVEFSKDLLLKKVEELGRFQSLSLDEQQTLAVSILNLFKSAVFTSCKSLIHEATHEITRLAKDLGKVPPGIRQDGDDYIFTDQGTQLLRNVFVHLLRNSMDHGIEDAKERQEKGKNPAGTLTFNFQKNKDRLHLLFSDDGRGLNLARIREKGLKMGLCSPETSIEQVASLIFLSDFSTAPSLTEISGRGVGMDAVRGFLREAGGDIEIVLHPNEAGSKDFLPFHFKISLPRPLWDQS